MNAYDDICWAKVGDSFLRVALERLCRKGGKQRAKAMMNVLGSIMAVSFLIFLLGDPSFLTGGYH